jgi:hypothetical protein
MQPSRRHCIYAFFALLACMLPVGHAQAETLTITTSPPGAKVEIDGMVAGTTPYRTEFPGGYFHKTHTAFSARLEHSIITRISKDGYVTQQVTLTTGPFDWVAINGRHRGNYFLLKSDHFEIKLEALAYRGNAPVETIGKEGPIRPAAAEPSPPTEKAASGSGSVSISSDPAGADIYADGKFVGQTPSTLSLSAGTHHIEVRGRSKGSWARDLDVLKDSQLTLRAVLGEGP